MGENVKFQRCEKIVVFALFFLFLFFTFQIIQY